jgi:hypothetical protein
MKFETWARGIASMARTDGIARDDRRAYGGSRYNDATRLRPARLAA